MLTVLACLAAGFALGWAVHAWTHECDPRAQEPMRKAKQ